MNVSNSVVINKRRKQHLVQTQRSQISCVLRIILIVPKRCYLQHWDECFKMMRPTQTVFSVCHRCVSEKQPLSFPAPILFFFNFFLHSFLIFVLYSLMFLKQGPLAHFRTSEICYRNVSSLLKTFCVFKAQFLSAQCSIS